MVATLHRRRSTRTLFPEQELHLHGHWASAGGRAYQHPRQAIEFLSRRGTVGRYGQPQEYAPARSVDDVHGAAAGGRGSHQHRCRGWIWHALVSRGAGKATPRHAFLLQQPREFYVVGHGAEGHGTDGARLSGAALV